MTIFEIRQVQGEALLNTLFPLMDFAFQPTPGPDRTEDWLERIPYMTSYTVMVGFEREDSGQERPVAAAFSVPMTQTVRGKLDNMIGIAGVSSHPSARRKGYIRQIIRQLYVAGREDGNGFAGLYPFRESFYERMGFVTFPQIKITCFASQTLAPLLKWELPGEVEQHGLSEALEIYETFLDQHQLAVHGMARYPDAPEERRHRKNPHWLAVARIEGEVVGVMTYKILKYNGDMQVTDFYYRSSEAKYLLLQWLARHIDQVTQIEMALPPYEQPETWLSDINVKIRSTDWVTPMGRVLDVTQIDRLRTGAANLQFSAHISDPDCDWNNGIFQFIAHEGHLIVEPSDHDQPDCNLTINGLSALIYGTHPPSDFRLRGWGDPSSEVQQVMLEIFPPLLPHMHAPY